MENSLYSRAFCADNIITFYFSQYMLLVFVLWIEPIFNTARRKKLASVVFYPNIVVCNPYRGLESYEATLLDMFDYQCSIHIAGVGRKRSNNAISRKARH